MKISIINIVSEEYREWIRFIIRALPASPICNKLRNIYWSTKFKNHKKIFNIGRMSNFYNAKIIEIGDNFCIGENSCIDASNSDEGVYIGDNVLIASGLFIRTANHKYDSIDTPIRLQGHKSKKNEYNGKNYYVVMENDVWISQNVTILTGVKIGVGSIIGAGCVIVRDIPPYSIVGIEPGKVIRNRKNKS